MFLGSSFLGFEVAQQFHPVYGPALVVAFTLLTQTLLITILISILSNTFAAIQSSADTEILHQNALRRLSLRSLGLAKLTALAAQARLSA